MDPKFLTCEADVQDIKKRRKSSVRFADDTETGDTSNCIQTEPTLNSVPSKLSLHFGLLRAGAIYESLLELPGPLTALYIPQEASSFLSATTLSTIAPSCPASSPSFLRVILAAELEGPLETTLRVICEGAHPGREQSVSITAHVMSKVKGTPSLRPYIRLIGRHNDLEANSDASDWQGFSKSV
mmetsp:Transcript_22668/g.31619  ORF Transcript_22668/g.31619 Transcript_22668/m.31619 type:complete len:184 (-) Transcript_22668:208-759(-)